MQNEAEREDDAELSDLRRERFTAWGFTDSQIDAMMDKQQSNKQQPASRTPTASGPANVSAKPHAPVYPKVHTGHMSIETLKYYDISWEYDQVLKDSMDIAVFLKLD